METEMDIFRARLRNWARVYRTGYERGESSLAKVLRALKRAAGIVEPPDPDANRTPVDILDAEFIDSCWRFLDETSRKILRVEYLTASPACFDDSDRAHQLETRKARYCGYWLNDYKRALYTAENRYREIVSSKESQ